MPYDLVSPFAPAGDQPRAIRELAGGLGRDDRYQTLLGVTGSGKTMTMAHVIAGFRRPTLVLSHNKTLAAQLYGELKSFFPKNAVEFFPAYDEQAVRIEFWGDTVEKIAKIDPLTGDTIAELAKTAVYPATHFVTERPTVERAVAAIRVELKERLAELRVQNKLLE